MENVYASLGRKQLALEEAYQDKRELLSVINALITGQLDKDRVVVDLKTNQCHIKPEKPAEQVPVPAPLGVTRKPRKQRQPKESQPAPQGAKTPEA